MPSPLYERLLSYARKNRISFAMPGHKNGRGLKKDLVSLDVTELDETENLHHGGEYVKKAQKLLSSLYGSDKSYILTGGSTAAIQSMICGALNPGDTLLAAADCHMSVINTCALLGIKIRLIPKQFDKDFSVPTITALSEDLVSPDVSAVLITSPNYYGVCSDIKVAADICHKKNIPLLVDEAHGAHFITGSPFPETAVKYADAVCHSAHKTLNALNGAAYLHANENLIDMSRTKQALSMFQSSSPSYVIAASADTARDELENVGKWRDICNQCALLRSQIAQTGIRVFENDDITRLVLNFSEFDITGFEISRRLSAKGIDIEMADLFNIVLIITPSNTEADLSALFDALSDIAKTAKKASGKVSVNPPSLCAYILNPQEAFFAKKFAMPLKDAAGRISASTVTAYPPGVPVIYMGEKITEQHIEYIQTLSDAGAEITGLSAGKISVKDQA